MSEFSVARDAVLTAKACYDSAMLAVDLAESNLWDKRIDLIPKMKCQNTYNYTNAVRGKTYEIRLDTINVNRVSETLDVRVRSLTYGEEIGLSPENLNEG